MRLFNSTMSYQSEHHLDKARVKFSFDRASRTYNHHAVLQQQVGQEMFNRLQWLRIKPKIIIDAGCGTGVWVPALLNQFSHTRVIALDFAWSMLLQMPIPHYIRRAYNRWRECYQHRICADIENLPLADGCADMIWSNLSVQWCDLERALREFHRSLAVGGLLTFTTFGPDTLHELRQATADHYTHINHFLDMHDIGDMLVKLGFDTPVLDVERYTLHYTSVQALWRDLRAIGVTNATYDRPKGFARTSFLTNIGDTL